MASGLRRFALKSLVSSQVRKVGTASSNRTAPSIPEVAGLSNKVVSVPSGNVGPGASKTTDYKNPEYFCYNVTSYHQAEVELLKYRLPQPTNKK